jgi:hypothetical protein
MQYILKIKKGLLLLLLISSSLLAQAQMFGGMPISKKQPSIVVPATITLAQNRNLLIGSVYDQDYMPYATPSTAATTSTQAADGVNETLANYQGTVTATTGVNVVIPVTATGNGTLPAFSTSVNVPANLTEDGISRTVVLSWAAQAYTAATVQIAANIKAVGGTLNIKKLDVNAGIGNNTLGVLLANFTYPYNNAGNTTAFQLRAIAAVPDRMFGIADASGNTTTHMSLYLPIVAEDGKTWLNYNLGANYSNTNSGVFNLGLDGAQHSVQNFNGFGYQFQWGRDPDGHEVVYWTGGQSWSYKSPDFWLPLTWSGGYEHYWMQNPGGHPYDYSSPQDNTLWQTGTSPTNPCPQGFRVPKFSELAGYVSAANITQMWEAAISTLRLTPGGTRTGSFQNTPIINSTGEGYYWSSDVSGEFAVVLKITASEVTGNAGWRINGASVRCIAD